MTQDRSSSSPLTGHEGKTDAELIAYCVGVLQTMKANGYQGIVWDELLKRFRTIASESTLRWIPVAESLPKSNVTVLCGVDNIVSTGYWTGHSWALDVNDDYDPHVLHPTHWMPLPEAPHV